MSTVSPTELQQNMAGVLARVEAGERVVIIRGGHPIAELRPIAGSRSAPRPFGLAAGAFVVPDDFDAALPEDILREFEGR